MRAITICQPYAELILLGEKRVENRTWPTSHRGPLLIHAGKSRTWLDSYEPLPDHMDFGAIVGCCHVVDCIGIADIISGRSSEFPWLQNHEHAVGPWCWVLEKVCRLKEPIPWCGAQKLWPVDIDEVDLAGLHWIPIEPRRTVNQ